jgi:hypothetical protein
MGLGMVLLCCLCTCAHDHVTVRRSRNDSTAYMNEAKAFIRWYIKDKGSNLIMSDKVVLDSQLTGWPQAIKDTFFTPGESAFVREQMGSPRFRQWSVTWFGSTNVIPDSLLRQRTGYYSLGYPVFLRHYTYCLFYADYRKDRADGFGSLDLYRRSGNEWVLIKSITDWVV